MDAAWPNSPVRTATFAAARIALEAQPVSTWRDRALAETNSRAGLTALLALARVGSTRTNPAQDRGALAARFPR